MGASVSYVDIYATLGTFPFTDVADERVDPTYLHKLSAPLGFVRSLPETGSGMPPDRYADVQLSNINTALTTEGSRYGTFLNGTENGYGDVPYGGTGDPTLSEILAVEDLRGKAAFVRIMDLDTQATLFSMGGVIAQPRAGGARASLRVESRHTSTFTQLLPTLRIIDLYPEADLAGAADQDAPVIKPFGTMRKARLVLVSEQPGAYDYGVLYKPATGALTVTTVYRDDRVLLVSEYSVVEAQPGYYVIRFATDRRENGQPLDIRVTVTSSEFSSPAGAVQWVLQALSLPVNAASFAAAASTYATLGYGGPAHGLHERRQASDILNDLLWSGAYIRLNTAGEYLITIDTLASHPAATLAIGAGDSHYDNGDAESIERTYPDDTERVGVLKLLGAFDIGFGGESSYLKTARQEIPGGTVTKEILCPYISGNNALNLESSYRAKRLRYSSESLSVKTDGDARTLTLGELVPLWIPNDAINGDSYELAQLSYSPSVNDGNVDGAFTCLFRSFNADIFTLTAAVLQISPGALSLTDYSYTIPDAPTGLALVSATPRAGSGTALEVLTVWAANAPAANITDMVFRVTPTGSILPLPGESVTGTAPGSVGVPGQLVLTPGLSYTIQAFARNRNNAPGYQDGIIAQLFNYLAPGDTTTPPTVTGVSVLTGTYKSLNISWNAVALSSLRNYEVQISLNSVFTAIVKTLTPTSRDVSVTGLQNSTTYWVQVRAVNFSGTAGGWSAAGAGSTTLIASPDITDGHITTPKLPDNAVTSSKRANVSNVSVNTTFSGASHTHDAGGGVSIGLSTMEAVQVFLPHGLGKKPLGVSTASLAIPAIVSSTTTSITVNLYNPIRWAVPQPVTLGFDFF